MSNQRKSSAPKALGDVLGELNNPVGIVTQVSRSHQRLVDRALEIRDFEVLEAQSLGFLSRVLVQVSLPHSNPGNNLEVWTRQNGNVYLTIQPKKYVRNGKIQTIGYPYGTIPRLLLIYLCTEAIRTNEPCIELGRSLSSFMHKLGMDATGGRWGSVQRLKDQMRRLLTAHIDFTYDNQGVTLDENASIAERSMLWWDSHQPEQDDLFTSFVQLNQKFFDQIVAHPVPLDLRAVRELQKSPLALDLYTWLTHRVTYLKETQRISWQSLSNQVGSDYSDVKNFKRKAKAELKKITVLWPDLKLDDVRGGFLVKPSRPHVPEKTLVAFPSAATLKK